MGNVLSGKVALITGSGRGIGHELALKLASQGARLVVNDLDESVGNACAESIREAGGEAIAVNGSVTDRDFAERFVGSAMEAFCGIDIVVNNAGYTWDSTIQKTTDEQWQSMLDVHVTAPFRLLRAAQPYLKSLVKSEVGLGKVNHRKVVNVSSMAGTAGGAGQSAYSSAKSAITGLTKTLAKEWGRLNINVNAVSFGIIDTRLTQTLDSDSTINIDGQQIPVGINKAVAAGMNAMIPLGRPGTAKEAANAIYLLCTPDSNYISGQVLTVNGGLN